MRLGIYIQVPFCQTKCTYCNFHTGVVSAERFGPYAQAVAAEIRGHQGLYATAGILLPELFSGAIVDTVYLGGGTPSLLAPRDIAGLIAAVCKAFTTDLAEVTLEADPETIDEEKSRAWLSAGINRISLGAQSFFDSELAAAGRMHRAADISCAVRALRAAGFANISLDLIAGLPKQTEESWRHSLEESLALEPEHVSVYMLEVDEGSRLGREILRGGSRYGAQEVPEEDAVAEFYDYAGGKLCDAGYRHYEISNWAKPGLESRHNLKYWKREPYLGFGAGAHSFSGVQRWANEHEPAVYVASLARGAIPVEQLERVTPKQALEEEIFLGLRQLKGIDLDSLEVRYGPWFRGDLRRKLAELESRGLVQSDGARVRLAPARAAVSNEVFVALLE